MAQVRSEPNRQQKRRKELLPWAYGTACPMCGLTMYEDQALDLDHSTPVALGGGDVPGDRITHASCNRSAGAVLGNQLRGYTSSRVPRVYYTPASRDW